MVGLGGDLCDDLRRFGCGIADAPVVGSIHPRRGPELHSQVAAAADGFIAVAWAAYGQQNGENKRHVSEEGEMQQIQETFNKVVTLPWYTTASIGFTRGW